MEMILGDADVERRLIEGLRARELREKFWYASDAAAEAWIALCASKAYRNYDRAGRTVADAAPRIAAWFAGTPTVEIVGLGAGDAAKEIAIAGAIRQARSIPCLVAVDVSRRLLDVALAEAHRRGIEARGVRADLDDPAHLEAIAATRTGPRLWTMLGNTVGALDRAATLGRLGRVLGRDDVLCVDGEVFDPQTTLGGYDNPDNRRFAWGPLADLGISEDDGTLDFWLEDSGGGIHAVRKRFTFERTARVRGIDFARGETLAMSRSEKYDFQVFPACVGAESGLRLFATFTGPDRRWTLVAARANG